MSASVGEESVAGLWRVPNCQQQFTPGTLALRLCDKGGFAAFHQGTCPGLSPSELGFLTDVPVGPLGTGLDSSERDVWGPQAPTDQVFFHASRGIAPTVPTLVPLDGKTGGQGQGPTVTSVPPARSGSGCLGDTPSQEGGSSLKAVRALCFSPRFLHLRAMGTKHQLYFFCHVSILALLPTS